MDSTSKNEEDAAIDFSLAQIMLKDNTEVKVDMEEPEKAKATSSKSGRR